jgi:hypothetical protein
MVLTFDNCSVMFLIKLSRLGAFHTSSADGCGASTGKPEEGSI